MHTISSITEYIKDIQSTFERSQKIFPKVNGFLNDFRLDIGECLIKINCFPPHL